MASAGSKGGTMTERSPAPAARVGEERKFHRGFAIRIFAPPVTPHVLGAFLYPLFLLGDGV